MADIQFSHRTLPIDTVETLEETTRKIDEILKEWSSNDSEEEYDKCTAQENVHYIDVEVTDEVTQEKEVVQATNISDVSHDHNYSMQNNQIDVSTDQDNPNEIDILEETPQHDRVSDSYTNQNISVDELEVERKIECEFCDELFGKDEDYREHLKIHLQEWKEKSKRIKKPKRKESFCELCNFRSQNGQSGITSHMKTFHKVSKTLQKVYECYICYLATAPNNNKAILFYSNEGMRIHIKHEHESEDWKFVCDICDSRFVNTYGLDLHKKSFHYRK